MRPRGRRNGDAPEGGITETDPRRRVTVAAVAAVATGSSVAAVGTAVVMAGEHVAEAGRPEVGNGVPNPDITGRTRVVVAVAGPLRRSARRPDPRPSLAAPAPECGRRGKSVGVTLDHTLDPTVH